MVTISGDSGDDVTRVKVLYIGGWGRSGSTLLDRMLGQIPGFFSAGELRHTWDRGFRRNQLCGCGVRFLRCPVWRDVIKTAFGERPDGLVDKMIALERRTESLLGAGSTLLSLIVRGSEWVARSEEGRVLAAWYAAIRSSTGCNYIVDSSKNPLYGWFLSLIPNMDVRMIHLVRDSRAVAFSWLRHKQLPDDPNGSQEMIRYSVMGSGVRWLVGNVLAEMASWRQGRTLRIRYEDLVAHPADTLTMILRWLGLPVELLAGQTELADGRVVLRPNHTVAGNPVRFKSGPLFLDLDDAWRTKMRRHEALTVGLLTWPLLWRYGYLSGPKGGRLKACTRPSRS